MIYVRMVGEPEYRQMRLSGYAVDYSEQDFFRILLEKEGAFADKESRTIVEMLHGTYVAKHWREGEKNEKGQEYVLPLSDETKYGLMALEYSREGKYLSYEKRFGEVETACRIGISALEAQKTPLVWDALSALDEDIYLLFRKCDFTFAWDIPLEHDFILENYSMNGIEQKVYVEYDGFAMEPYEQGGILHVANFFYDQKYDWKEDIDGILESMNHEIALRTPMAKISDEYDIYSFDALLRTESWNSLSADCLENKKKREDYGMDIPEHPWENLRIINHMYRTPGHTDSRRLFYMMIHQHENGSYSLHDAISVKYPSYTEMFEEALAYRPEEGMVFFLVIDHNEILRKAEEILQAVCAFKMQGGKVETYDESDGLAEFSALLKEARKSGIGVDAKDKNCL